MNEWTLLDFTSMSKAKWKNIGQMSIDTIYCQLSLHIVLYFGLDWRWCCIWIQTLVEEHVWMAKQLFVKHNHLPPILMLIREPELGPRVRNSFIIVGFWTRIYIQQLMHMDKILTAKKYFENNICTLFTKNKTKFFKSYNFILNETCPFLDRPWAYQQHISCPNLPHNDLGCHDRTRTCDA
jgi:hypothetical protein